MKLAALALLASALACAPRDRSYAASSVTVAAETTSGCSWQAPVWVTHPPDLSSRLSDATRGF